MRRLRSTVVSLRVALSLTDSCWTSWRTAWPHLWLSLWRRSIDRASDVLGAWHKTDDRHFSNTFHTTTATLMDRLSDQSKMHTYKRHVTWAQQKIRWPAFLELFHVRQNFQGKTFEHWWNKLSDAVSQTTEHSKNWNNRGSNKRLCVCVSKLSMKQGIMLQSTTPRSQ